MYRLKPIIDLFKRILSLELVCLLSLSAAIIFDMYYLDLENPLRYSLSETGRLNPALFIVWCIVSGFALATNVIRLYDRVGYSGKIGRITLWVGLLCIVATFCNMSRDPVLFNIHVVTAALFAAFEFVAVVSALIFASKKSKRYLILTSIFCAGLLVDVIFLIIYKQMALFEFIPLIAAYVVLLMTNYTKTFRLK